MSMLGRRVRRYYWRFNGHEWAWRTPDADRSVRFLKFKENRQWRREYENELEEQEDTVALMPDPRVNDPIQNCPSCGNSFRRSDNHHHGPTQGDKPKPKEK